MTPEELAKFNRSTVTALFSKIKPGEMIAVLITVDEKAENLSIYGLSQASIDQVLVLLKSQPGFTVVESR